MNPDSQHIMRSGSSIWLSWERHRRSQSLAAKLGVSLYEFQSNAPRWVKHPLFAFRTLLLLIKIRPRLFFVQNPSVVLTILAILFKPIFGYKLIVDAHNAAVYPFEKGHEKFALIFPFIHRHADLTIVTNKVLADIVEGNGGKVALLPDPLPEFHLKGKKLHGKSGKFIVTYICSFSSDEPYLKVFEAAAQLPDNIKIFVTGNNNKLSKNERELAQSNNIELTGFLSDEDYLQQLCDSDCIMVLTEFNDCMVCGAYEAVSLGIPLILSRSPVLKNWFGDEPLFVRNNSSEIVDAILKCKKKMQSAEYSLLFNEWRAGINQKWHLAFIELKEIVESHFGETF